MDQFRVDQYQVSVRRQGRSEQPRPAIFAKSDNSTGVTTTLMMYFAPRNRTMIDNDYLGTATIRTHSAIELSVHMGPDSFEAIYDILRTESPITVLYDTRPSGSAVSSAVTMVQVGTHWEDTGEGPTDSDQ